MDAFIGHIEYKPTGQGSKSEGFGAFLITPEGVSYRLYRKGVFEISDSFFEPFDQQEVEINGELEETGFICVISIKSSESGLIQIPESPFLASDLVFHSEDTSSNTGEKNELIRVKHQSFNRKKKTNNSLKRKKK